MSWNTLAFRLAIALVPLIAIWSSSLLVFGAAHDPQLHVLRGAVVSVLVLAVVACLLRLDRLPWRVAGHQTLRDNLRAFALGAALWLLPALAGMAACIGLGWSSISLHSSPGTLFAALPLLALGVFLFEAFPEELALRGYMQGLLARRTAQWIALLLQAGLFTLFAWAIGALDTAQQWVFIPCLGLILGYVRALSGNAWTGMGVHAAWMTTSQLIAGHFTVEGLETMHFIAFALLPSATIGAALGMLRPGFSWRTRTTA